MKEIIKDLELLREASEPLKFIDAEGNHEEEVKEVINELQEVFDSDTNLVALAAPQIGIKKRVFGIRFDKEIKYFINPIITKKFGQIVAPEYFSSMPGKEILLGRPKEITVVYYTKELKYEDNKLFGAAARVFDQMAQLLDGVVPSDLGLVSDIETAGSFFDLTEEEMDQARDIWKQFVEKKLAALEAEINSDEDTKKVYENLRFSESVINGRTTVVADDPKIDLVQKRRTEQQMRKVQMSNFLRSKKR